MARPEGLILKLKWDTEELERIRTIKTRTGMKNTTEVVRVALMEKYERVIGSPTPAKSS